MQVGGQALDRRGCERMNWNWDKGKINWTPRAADLFGVNAGRDLTRALTWRLEGGRNLTQ